MNSIIFKIFILPSLLLGANINAQVSIDSVRVGNQVWMTRDLDVTHYRNGDSIPEAVSVFFAIKYDKNHLGYWYYGNFDKSHKKMYNWFAVNDKRGLAPIGWHIPDKHEYKTLINFLGIYPGQKMKKGPGWDYYCDSSNTDGTICNGTNESKLSFLPSDNSIHNMFLWWTSSSSDWQSAFCLFLGCGGGALVLADKYCIKTNGFPVRCIKGEYVDKSKKKKRGYYH